MKILRILLLVTLIIPAFLIAPRSAVAGGTELMQGETSVTLPAGGEVRVKIKTFCLQFGEPYPAEMGTPEGRASDRVIQILSAATSSDEINSNQLIPQLAIWAAEESNKPEELYDQPLADIDAVHALQDKAATTEVVPNRTDQGVLLDQAIAEGMVEITAENFQVLDAPQAVPNDSPYHGEATMVIRNKSDRDLQLYVPFGFKITAPNEAEQDLAAIVTDPPQSAPMPATMAETGAAEAGLMLPLLLAAAGTALLAGAGVLTARKGRA